MENGTETAETVPEAEPPTPPKDEQAATIPTAGKSYLQEDLNVVLEFLSNANNETLIACFFVLGLFTYAILGRVGLVLIGVVGGVVLHATWEGKEGDMGEGRLELQKSKRQKETGLDVIQRILEWREQKKTTMGEDGQPEDVDVLLSAQKQLDFTGFPPATGGALTGFVDAVIRDYVK